MIGMVSTFTQVIPSDSSACIFFRFGAEKVLLASGLIWGLLTFWFQKIVHVTAPDLKLVVFTRILIGAAQGVHFPALVSLSLISTTNSRKSQSKQYIAVNFRPVFHPKI